VISAIFAGAPIGIFDIPTVRNVSFLESQRQRTNIRPKRMKTNVQKWNKKDQLTLTNPRDSKGCKNCSNLTCFVSYHRIPFPQISNYQCIASRGMFRL